MAKLKKKQSKKSKDTTHPFDNAAKSLKKFRKATKHIRKLSTAQKVVGGVALLAAGLTYLAKRQSTASAASTTPDAEAAEANLATLNDEPQPEADSPTSNAQKNSKGK